MTDMRLSVVVPARNEAQNIGPTLDAIRERLKREGITCEIVVVNDGSSYARAQEGQAGRAADPGVRLLPQARGLSCITGNPCGSGVHPGFEAGGSRERLRPPKRGNDRVR